MSETPHKETPKGWGHVDLTPILNPSSRMAYWGSRLAVTFGIVFLGLFLVALGRLAVVLFAGDSDQLFKAATILFPVLAASFAAPFFIWKMFLTHQTTLAAQAQAKAAEAKLDIDRETQFLTLFTKATELLGQTREIKTISTTSQKQSILNITQVDIESRVSAIVILEKLCRKTPQFHKETIDIISSYIRNNSGYDEFGNPIVFNQIKNNWKKPRADIQAALRMLGERKSKWFGFTDEFSLINLSQCKIPSADLQGCDFSSCNFSESNLEGCLIANSNFDNTLMVDCNLKNIITINSTFRFAHFSDSDLSINSKSNSIDIYINQIQINSAQGNTKTILPNHIQRPQNWR